MLSNILVTGGAGYIGSHVCISLIEAGYNVTVLDNLSTGIRSLIPKGAHFVQGSTADRDLVSKLLLTYEIEAVMHFAASTVVPESLANPLKYYENNTCASRNLIQSCYEAGVKYFIFSSTAAVYGNPSNLPVHEEAPLAPVSPYGWSKLMTEQILSDVSMMSDLKHVALRYFNVAGADSLGRTGQSTPNATHLIKVACEAACGKRDGLTIFGDDYDTPDGTCIRDYIHVSDLADVHVSALKYLVNGGDSVKLNCGYGRGFSIFEIVHILEKISGETLKVKIGPRRAGDIVSMYSASDKICQTFHWQAKWDDLGKIVESAYLWEKNNPSSKLNQNRSAAS